MHATHLRSIEHRAIDQVLACLEKLADRFESGEALDRISAWQALDFFRYFAGSWDPRIAELRQEHKLGRECIDAMMLALVRGAGLDFAASARRYVRLLREHLRPEDSDLFPAAETFSPAGDDELSRAYQHRENDEMEEGTHDDYLELANTLADRLGVPRAVAESFGDPLGYHRVHA